MSKTRSELREKAMVILYQIDIMKSNKVDFNIEELISENLEIDSDFVRNIVYGVVTHMDQLNELANKNMKDWSIERIDKTGAAILRIGLYEILYEDDTPNIVAINEAVELAKKFSDDNVRKIINAVLDKVSNEN
ncbi:MAG TPA: transcription antitermination factor NusB [Candidatus Coprovivens excrementavium]|nr:transcription antitermination factor NusB [Candidatus Coprovivens excrementavium]